MSPVERCAECGFDGAKLTVADAIAALRSLGSRWRRLFDGVDDDILRRRPDPQTWSALEYAAHTRDVIALNGAGMHHVLEGRAVDLPETEPEALGADHGYNVLDPGAVLGELEANANRMADRAARVVGDEPWTRTARIGGEAYDAGWALRHAVHDATHHLRDVERGFRGLT